MQKLKRFLFSKRFFIVLLALLQMGLFYLLTVRLYTAGAVIYYFMVLFSLMTVLYVFERDDMNPAYKIFWMLNMVVFPVTGAVFYVMYGDTKMTPKQKRHIERVMERTAKVMVYNPQVTEKIERLDKGMARQARYLERQAHAPAYENTSVKYYDMGAAYFHNLLTDLENAEKTIFMQYFIIDEGYMWGRILDVLKRKAKRFGLEQTSVVLPVPKSVLNFTITMRAMNHGRLQLL